MNTKALVTMTASIIAANAVLADDWTVEEDTRLSADKTVDTLTVNAGVTLDLNGYSLTCTSLAGTGTITSPSGDLTSPSGTVTWSTNGGTAQTASGNGANLFNNTSPSNASGCSNNDKRIMVTTANLPLAVTYDFGEGNARKVDKYKIYFYRPNYESRSTNWHRGPKTWTFQGSNDGETWKDLDTVGAEDGVSWLTKNCSPKEFSFSNDAAYRFYRITFTASSDATYLELHQLEYFDIGELHVNVPSGETTNSTVAISGNVKVVKEGLGTFIATKSNQSYTGGTVILAGMLKAGEAGYEAVFGDNSSEVTVSSGGIFDVNGKTRMGNYKFILDGGTVKNDSTGITANSGKLVEVSLTADSTFNFANNYGLYDPDNNAPILSLAGHTLTLQGSGGAIIENATATTSGNINAIGGNVQFWGRSETERQTDFRNVSLTLGIDAQMFTYNAPGGVLLGDLVCNTASADTGHDGAKYQKATPKVYGTFKPNTDYFHGVELQDGATIDLSGRTTALPLRGLQYPSTAATATSLHTVTFAAPEEPAESITIYVKLGERDAHGKLISWDSIPSGVNFVSASGEKERSFLVTDRGLSLSTGFKIIFR